MHVLQNYFAPFKKNGTEALIIGIIGRDYNVEGIISFRVKVDGDDATKALIKAVRSTRFLDQIKLIALNGITVGGLNVIDINDVSKELGIPIIGITRKRPRIKLLMAASRDSKKKVKILEKTAKNIRVERMRGYYIQHMMKDSKGMEKRLHEALHFIRLAHLIASGIVHGESHGRL